LNNRRLIGSVAAWFAFKLFRGPFARRSKRIHTWTMKLFRYGAEKGNSEALTTYGSLLYFRGADQQSRQQGALFLQAAADQNDPKALWLVGKLYQEGALPSFPKNEDEAQGYFMRAAKGGHPLAASLIEKQGHKN